MPMSIKATPHNAYSSPRSGITLIITQKRSTSSTLTPQSISPKQLRNAKQLKLMFIIRLNSMITLAQLTSMIQLTIAGLRLSSLELAHIRLT